MGNVNFSNIGELPIKKGRDGNIIINEASAIQQCKFVSIILLVLLIPFSIMMRMANPDTTKFLVFLFFGAIAFIIGAYGFDGRYIFDTRTKEIIKEKNVLFQPTRTRFCSFRDIAMLGVCSFLTKGKNGRVFENFKLMMALKSQPDKLITLVNGAGITHTLGLEEINKIFLIVKEITNCQKCFMGEPGRTIEFVNDMGGYDYVQTDSEVSIF